MPSPARPPVVGDVSVIKVARLGFVRVIRDLQRRDGGAVVEYYPLVNEKASGERDPRPLVFIAVQKRNVRIVNTGAHSECH